jgi:hypothetical protein
MIYALTGRRDDKNEIVDVILNKKSDVDWWCQELEIYKN